MKVIYSVCQEKVDKCLVFEGEGCLFKFVESYGKLLINFFEVVFLILVNYKGINLGVYFVVLIDLKEVCFVFGLGCLFVKFGENDFG